MENLLIAKKDIIDTPNIIYKTHMHWISYILPIIQIILGILGVLMLLLITNLSLLKIIGFGLICLLIRGFINYLHIKSIKVCLTNTHLTIKSGIFSLKVIDIPLNKRENITLYQTFLGKKLNYGTFVISTGGITLTYILNNPIELRQQILKRD